MRVVWLTTALHLTAMNPLILTKISKHTLIGSISALLSFASKNSPEVKLFFVYGYLGLVFILGAVILWEGREQISSSTLPTEEGLNQLLSTLNASPVTKQKRQYLLPPSARLELVIAIAVITIAALVGAI